MAGGRPTKYLPVYAKVVSRLVEFTGATRFEIAKLLEVGHGTLQRWEMAYPEFRAALRVRAREACDSRVERTLYERAVGYSFTSEKIFCQEGLVIRAETVEHVPPDVKAAELWLLNRQPEHWKPRKAIEEAAPPIQITFHDPTATPAGYDRKRRALTVEGKAA